MNLITFTKTDDCINHYVTIRYINKELSIYLAKHPVKAYIIEFKPFRIQRKEWTESF